MSASFDGSEGRRHPQSESAAFSWKFDALKFKQVRDNGRKKEIFNPRRPEVDDAGATRKLLQRHLDLSVQTKVTFGQLWKSHMVTIL